MFEISWLPCLLVFLVVLIVVMVWALGRLGRGKTGGPGPGVYQPPEISGGEYVSGCSGGHTDRPYWGTSAKIVYGLPRW